MDNLLMEWAVQWGVPLPAIVDFKRRVGAYVDGVTPAIDPNAGTPGSEVRQQSLVRLEAPKFGVWLTRNNVGALMDRRNVPVRYGLANESPAQNKAVKSGDLIGMREVLIGPHHVGKVLAQFVSREIKHEGWTYSGTEHEVAQLAWINFVNSHGGDACFTTGPGSFNHMRFKT